MSISRSFFTKRVPLFVFTVLGLVGINLIWLVPTIQNVRNTASSLSLEIARRANSEIDLSLRNEIDDLAEVADLIAFEPERTEIILRQYLKHHTTIRNIALVNPEGGDLFRLDRFELISDEDFEDHSKSAYFYFALQGAQTMSEVFFSEESEPHTILAVPVRYRGEIQQVLTADLNLLKFTLALRKLDLETGHIYIVDSNGFRIGHPDISELLKRPDFSDRAIVQKVITDGISANGLSPDDSYINEVGERVFTVGVFSPFSGWGVFVEQPQTRALAGERQAKAFAGLVILLGSIIGFIFLQNNVRLTRLNTILKERNDESTVSAKILIRKDRELTNRNAELATLNTEMESVGKLLVRRDLELTRANERLRELDAVKSEFISIVAHQLRTPLTTIRWTYDLLAEQEVGALNTEQEHAVSGGLKTTIYLIDLVNDLLNVARIEEGRFDFVFKSCSMAQLMTSLVAQFEKNALARSVELVLEMDANSIPEIPIDEDKMIVALGNLIDNAIKYTDVKGRVTVRVSKRDEETIQIDVADNGIGIPKTQSSRLFSKFFRADNAKLFNTVGSGLGLYISQNIIKNHDGAIKVRSEEDEGSTFTVTLPIKREE